MKERPVLGITHEAIDKNNLEFSSSESPIHYLTSNLPLINNEQPEFYEYLIDAEERFVLFDNLSFLMGAVQSYNLVPDEQRKKELTKDQLELVRANFQESAVTETDERVTLNVSWFLEKMSNDSRAYTEWMLETVEFLEDRRSRNDFVLGSFITLMPFYAREEARRLEERFGGDNS